MSEEQGIFGAVGILIIVAIFSILIAALNAAVKEIKKRLNKIDPPSF